MADTNNPRRDDFAGFSENDPFAELTRIMGHDPRDPVQPAPVAHVSQPAAAQEPEFGDDFDIDLENELLGELGLDDFTETEPQPEPQPVSYSEPVVEARAEERWDAHHAPAPSYDNSPVYPEPVAREEVVAPAPEEPDFSEFEAAFDDLALEPLDELLQAEDDNFGDAEYDEPVPYPAPRAAAPVEPEAVFEDDFDVALERELFGEVSAPFEAVSEEPVAAEPSSFADQADDGYAAPPEPENTYAAASVPVWQEEPQTEAIASDDGEYEDEFFGDLVVGEEEEVSATSEPVPYAETPASLTLEDELTALLSDEPIVAPVARAELAPWAPEPAAALDNAPAPEVAPAPVTSPRSSTWPLASSIGRANFAPAQSSTSSTYSPAPVAPAAAGAISSVAATATATPEAVYAPELDDAVSDTRYEAAADHDEFDNLFADGFDLEAELHAATDDAQQIAAVETHTEFAPAPVTTPLVSGLEALASWQPEHERVATPVVQTSHGFAPAAQEEAPEIETVELTEAAVAVADDLDIPEIAYEAPTAPAQYADLDSEIAEAFGDLSLDEPESAPVSQTATTSWSSSSSASAAVSAALGAGMGYVTQSNTRDAAPSPASSKATTGQPAQSNQWEPQDLLPADQFDFDADLDQAIAMATYQDDAATAGIRGTQSRSRIIKLAAIAGGLVLLGGVGLLASSYFGGESSGPALVRADSEPMKVRPENPGGTTVPNQDSPVYQSVAGTTPAAVPEQERLISGAEEPVDVTAQGDDTAMLPPGVGSELEDVIGDSSGTPKAEDRIEPEAGAASAAVDDGPAVVAPRRVRTMVVRPDGTMVPREEVTPVAEAQPQQQALVTPPVGQTPTLETAGNLLPPVEDEGGPTVNTPATVSVVPTRRTEPSAAPAVAQAPAPVATPAAPPATAPAATPVSAPAAAAQVSGATSEWSMQIASQPTAEGAQAAYQDLARRYGSVLQGRGVNIVRADIQGMGTYYRVRIPASSRDEAIQLCTRYKSSGGSCFVSR